MTSSFHESIDYVNKKIQEMLEHVGQEQVKEIIHLFTTAKRIFIYGTGRSGLVGRAFAIRLVHLGFQTFVIGETITAPVQKGDLVVLISGSGKTIPVAMTAEIAKRLGAKIISITADPESHIARFADAVVALVTEKKNACLAPLGTLFEASTWVFLDGIS